MEEDEVHLMPYDEEKECEESDTELKKISRAKLPPLQFAHKICTHTHTRATRATIYLQTARMHQSAQLGRARAGRLLPPLPPSAAISLIEARTRCVAGGARCRL